MSAGDTPASPQSQSQSQRRSANAALKAQLAVRAWELLGDTDWHDLEPVLQNLMRLVPPGVALREHEKARALDRAGRERRRGAPPDQARAHPHPTSRESRQRTGARKVVRDFLRSASGGKSAAAFERRTRDGGVRQIRMLRPMRASRADPLAAIRDRLDLENQLLRGQVKALADYLASLGHGDAAAALAPPLSDRLSE